MEEIERRTDWLYCNVSRPCDGSMMMDEFVCVCSGDCVYTKHKILLSFTHTTLRYHASLKHFHIELHIL